MLASFLHNDSSSGSKLRLRRGSKEGQNVGGGGNDGSNTAAWAWTISPICTFSRSNSA
jgi:hypothetical protein